MLIDSRVKQGPWVEIKIQTAGEHQGEEKQRYEHC
jgi:hypothetical protein